MARIVMMLSVPDSTGAARMLFYFARSLRSRGHEVLVLHGPPPGTDGGILPELAAIEVETRPVPLLRRPVPPFVYRAAVEAAGDPDLVIGVNQRDRAVAAHVGASLGLPSVLAVQNQHNFWGPARRWKRRYYAASVRDHVEVCICSSDAVRHELVAMGVSDQRCVVLHNGIDLDATPSLESRAPSSGRVFVNVGRLDIQKGQDVLLRAWARSNPGPADRLLLVGDVTDGNQRRRSQRFKRELLQLMSELELGESVRLLGWRDDVSELLAGAHVYVHAARWEGWPLAVVEAMAASRPFIMTDCSGPPSGFDGRSQGYVVPTDDVDALAGAIRAARALPEAELTAMGLAARSLAEEHYDIDVVGRRFAEIVEGVLAADLGSLR